MGVSTLCDARMGQLVVDHRGLWRGCSIRCAPVRLGIHSVSICSMCLVRPVPLPAYERFSHSVCAGSSLDRAVEEGDSKGYLEGWIHSCRVGSDR